MGRFSEPQLGFLVAAAGPDAPGNLNHESVYRNPATGKFYAGGRAGTKTGEVLAAAGYIEPSGNVGWLPSITGWDTELQQYRLTRLGWARVAQQIGGADKAKQLLGGCPQ